MHVTCFSALLAFAAPAAGSQSGPQQSPLSSLLVPIVCFGLIFYFLMFRPQQQRAKQQAKMLAAMKAGDKVITSAGIVGTVITVKDKTVTIRSADAKFEVTKASITEIVADDASTPTAS
ncbi:MAG TPA: preprotein translocase subunit YajC [Verrucomicrobiae bacterium]|jgi:preprotein translocase subunit YajC|nr:preprotein translocase subunit YajC [Verrucomicrobiae bacterium]